MRTETVTEETSRSTGEAFSNRQAARREEDEGLSNLEKFALGALGVAAVSAILNRDDEVVASAEDRVVVRDDTGSYRVLKNDDALLRQPGSQVQTQTFSDGSSLSTYLREDGQQVRTIRAANGQVLRRSVIRADGSEVVLFDDTAQSEPVDVARLQRETRAPGPVRLGSDEDLRSALMALDNPAARRFSLQQVRQIRAVRELVPLIELDEINFETGSAIIRPEEARDLRDIGQAIAEAIRENPGEVFLIEGHTDAVGSASMNLTLSDRRAESAALALTEFFDIPPENLVVQGYGEANLKIVTQEAQRENRRVAVRRITPLLQTAAR